MSEDYQPYLDTLRRVPDDIILSIATRPISPSRTSECVCGWLSREVAARRSGVDAEDASVGEVGVYGLSKRFGGDVTDEWCQINWAFQFPSEEANLERAFVERVLEAVSA